MELPWMRLKVESAKTESEKLEREISLLGSANLYSFSEDPKRILRQFFGYTEFRGRQEEIINHVVAGRHAVVLMPTGSGKSLCYQIPALIRRGTGIVVSPLIALMKDQVDALEQAGVKAAFLNSSLLPHEARGIEEKLRGSEVDLLYVAPERVMTEAFQELLAKIEIALFAIDEAHCVSQWGHNFRPEYAELSVLHTRFPRVPMIALTATADGPTRSDIFNRLGLKDAALFVSGFDRPNITYKVVDKNKAKAQLLSFIKSEHSGDAGIIYCQTRKKVEETADWLTEQGVAALPYHAGLEAVVRERNHLRFIREEGIVVVATIAFGMGIDKPNVRFVAHLDVPRSLEAYYQETGRAGRDGLPATAWMTYGLADVVETKWRIQSSELDQRQKRIELQKFEALLGYCESLVCRREVLLTYFGDKAPVKCSNCDTCIKPPESWDGVEVAQKALSAVYRTGQIFGAGYLTDVLLGKLTPRIKEWNHHQIKTFGVGKDLPEQQWFGIFRQLVAANYLSVDIEGHGALKLNENSAALLKGNIPIRFRTITSQPTTKTRQGTRTVGTNGTVEQIDQDLWEELRQKRLSLSRQQNVPPYVIFHDATLLEMAKQKPSTLAEMARITGVGASKLERYGQIFLEVIDTHRG
jgi:ATP-dependent DNA helicase RecQ